MTDLGQQSMNYMSFVRLLSQDVYHEGADLKYILKEKQAMAASISETNKQFELIKLTLGQDAHDILRAKYIDKLTHDQIAKKFHYCEKTIRRKIKTWEEEYSKRKS